VKQDVVKPTQDGIEQNFGNVFDKFLREGTIVPGNAQNDQPKQENTENFASRISKSVVKLEDPCVEIDVENKSNVIVSLCAPSRVDFGDQITVTWENKGVATNLDWIAMYADDKTLREYYTYQYVDPSKNNITFYAPYSCANFFYFVYYSDKTYNLRAESNVVLIGPQYSLAVVSCVESSKPNEKFQVTLTIKQESGKECSNLWIGCYLDNEKNLKSFVSYQYCTAGKEVVFGIPKSGSWNFKLFPFKSFEPILSLPYFIEGEDKLQLSLVNGQFLIVYDIKTLDLATSKPWIGIYESSTADVKQWVRYNWVGQVYKGLFTIVANLNPGRYEARLLDYYTSFIVAKSEVVEIGETTTTTTV